MALLDLEQAHAVRFTVDSALLTELGERLVGKPHIALAELIKNAYDADARTVELHFEDDRIEIVDDGHGMQNQEFIDFWMRIGSPHKRFDQRSRRLGRPLTGSKGVGRLAAQFLARNLELVTTSDEAGGVPLGATVDWDKAVAKGNLTDAEAQLGKVVGESRYALNSKHGTRVVLRELNQIWDAAALKALAREIWWLRQPFRNRDKINTSDPLAFEVVFRGRNIEEDVAFEDQINAIQSIWTARLDGELTGERDTSGNALARVSLRFDDESVRQETYRIDNCLLGKANFQIRIYNLVNRQPQGISVKDAREYMRKYGGVHVYDRGFHLPYYGTEQDWLGIEQDHSQREWTSKLLPPELQVSRGLNDLPTNARILGVVNVDTSSEEKSTSEEIKRKGGYLQIQLTRDRLVQNAAYENLVHFVRWALDFYANEYRRRQIELEKPSEVIAPLERKFEEVGEVLERHRDDIPPTAFREIEQSLHEATKAAVTRNETLVRQSSLLGSLAAAGISSLAFQHELGGMSNELDGIVQSISSVKTPDPVAQAALKETSERLTVWLERFRGTRGLFSHLIDKDNREERFQANARVVIDRVYSNLGRLMRNVAFDTSRIDPRLTLPSATFAELSSVFQNVFINAVNAMLDVPLALRKIVVSSETRGKRTIILVQDTGVGVNLIRAPRYFDAFERELEISEERRSLGMGGTGLGLTIVRTIAENLGCQVNFVPPEEGFSTAFALSWEETGND